MEVPIIKPKPWEKLAINIYDVESLPVDIYMKFFKTSTSDSKLVLEKDKLIRIHEDRPLDIGVLFSCDVLEAATTCDLVRSYNRKKKMKVSRLYILRKDSWVKIREEVPLTEVVDSQVRLRPAVFTSQSHPAETVYIPMPFYRI